MSKYPTEIDSDKELPSALDGATENASESINALKDAVLSVEKTIGTAPQGTMPNLNERINVSLNANGTLKSSAVIAAGLVSLPITNAQVSVSAAIAESKLDLDHSTQDLKDVIDSHETDISQLQDGVSLIGGNLSTHVTGAGYKHYANQVLLSPLVNSQLNVQGSLADNSSRIDNHIGSGTAHAAANITYVPPATSSLTATNVQAAITEIVDGEVGNLYTHQKIEHYNQISEFSQKTLSGQSNLNAASLAIANFLPTGGQKIIKVGQINSAAIKSFGFSSLYLTASSSNIDIKYEDGYSEKTLSVTGLGSLTSLDEVISSFNSLFATNKAPLTAFSLGSEFVVQHNWPAYSFSFETPSTNSAVIALGLSNVISQKATISNDFYSVTDGVHRNVEDNINTVSMQLLTNSNILNLPFSLSVGTLLNIKEHTRDSNGVYQVVSVAGATHTLNQSVLDGYFVAAAYSDSLSIGAASSGEIYEVYVDSDLKTKKHLKASVTLSQISNIQMLSADISPGAYSLSVIQDGAFLKITLSSGLKVGPTLSVRNGFVGRAHLNNYLGQEIVIDILGSIPGAQTDQFTVYESLDVVLNQKIGSFYTNGSISSKPLDLRNSKSELDFNYSGLEKFLELTQSSGTITTKENHSLIENNRFYLPALTLTGSSFANNTYTIYVTNAGEVKQTTLLTISDIVALKGIPLLKFTAASGLFSSVLNLSIKRTAITLDKIYVSDKAIAHTVNVSGASALATDLGIKLVVDTFGSSEALTLTGSVDFIGECEFSTVVANAAIVNAENLICETLTLSSATYLRAIKLSASTSLDVNSSVVSFESLQASSVTLSGTSPLLRGESKNSKASGLTGITVSGTTDAVISDGVFVSSGLSAALITVTGTNKNLSLCSVYSDNAIITASNARSASFYGINLTGTLDKLTLDNCFMSYRSSILNIGNSTVISELSIRNCTFNSIGSIITNTGNGVVLAAVINNISVNGLASILFSSGSGSFTNFDAVGIFVSGSFSGSVEPVSILNTIDGSVRISKFKLSGISSTLSMFETNGTSVVLSDVFLVSWTSTKHLFSLTNSDAVVSGLNGTVNCDLLKGHYLTLIGSNLTITKSTTAPVQINIGSVTKNRLKIIDSKLSLGFTSTFNFFDAWLSNSDFTSGSFVFSNTVGDTTGLFLANNNFIATKTSDNYSFDFTGLNASGLLNIAKMNKFSGSPTTALARFSSASCNVTGNVFFFSGSVSGESIIQIGLTNSATGTRVFESNQLKINSGSVQGAFRIIESNCIVSNSTIEGTSSYGFQGIGSSTQSSVKCFSNVFLTTPTIATTNLNTQCLVRDNIGCFELIHIQPFGASLQPSTSWSVINNEVKSTVANAIFYIGLPVPYSEIVSVSVESFATGSVNCSLLYRQSILSSTVEIGSATSVVTGAVQDIVIVPAVPYYANQRQGLLLKVTATTVGSFFGNIKVKYKL